MTKSEITNQLDAFESKMGYAFKNRALLINALSHSSYTNEQGLSKQSSYERLEFLGDAILETVVSEYLYKNFPLEPEGVLTKLRSAVVCESSFAGVATELELGAYMLLGKGEEANGGRHRASLVSDVFEAVVAAIYLDSDIETVRAWVLKQLKEKVELAAKGKSAMDYKTMLQELVQKGDTGKVSYRVTSEYGPDHAKTFEVEVMVDGEVKAAGKGSSKKDAEQNAAAVVYENLR